MMAALCCTACSLSDGDDVPPLCDGSGTPLQVYSRPSGNPLAGTEVLGDPSPFLVIIESDCQYWVQTSSSSELGRGYSGTLTAAEAEELGRIIHLSDWNNLEPDYYDSTSHSSVFKYVYGDYGTTIGEIGPGPAPHQIPSYLRDFLSELVDFLIARGSPASGEVRASVVVEGSLSPSNPEYESAPAWPFSFDPETVAVAEHEAGLHFPDYVFSLEGAEAVTARQLRDSALAGDFGVPWKSFVPVVGSDGTWYRVNFRDVGPYETADGELALP